MESNELKKIVLLVDDAPSNIQVVNSILKDLYKIRIATNGPKALELVKVAPPPDLILLDVLMPGMDGYEVCMRLKADPETKDIPVIFLTGQTETQDETRGFEVGAVDYIHKPFSPAVVKARVQTHLVLRGIREQLAQQLLAIQKELETARLIQQSILPESVPQIDVPRNRRALRSYDLGRRRLLRLHRRRQQARRHPCSRRLWPRHARGSHSIHAEDRAGSAGRLRR